MAWQRRARAAVPGDTDARELARVKESSLLLTKPVAPAKLRSTLQALLSLTAE